MKTGTASSPSVLEWVKPGTQQKTAYVPKANLLEPLLHLLILLFSPNADGIEALHTARSSNGHQTSTILTNAI